VAEGRRSGATAPSDAGGPGLFERVYLRYRPALIQYFRKRGASTAEAEELAQDVFVRILSSAGFAAADNPEAFLFTVASNVLRDRHRMLKVRAALPAQDLMDASVIDAPVDPERATAARRRSAQVAAVLRGLDPEVRRVFLLNRFEGYSYRQLSAQLGVTVAEIRRRMAVAIEALLRLPDPDADPAHDRASGTS